MFQVGDTVRVERRRNDVEIASYWARRYWRVITVHQNGLLLQGMRLDNTGVVRDRHIMSRGMIDNYAVVTKV